MCPLSRTSFRKPVATIPAPTSRNNCSSVSGCTDRVPGQPSQWRESPNGSAGRSGTPVSAETLSAISQQFLTSTSVGRWRPCCSVVPSGQMTMCGGCAARASSSCHGSFAHRTGSGTRRSSTRRSRGWSNRLRPPRSSLERCLLAYRPPRRGAASLAGVQVLRPLHVVLDPPAEERVPDDRAVGLPEGAVRPQPVDERVLLVRELELAHHPDLLLLEVGRRSLVPVPPLLRLEEPFPLLRRRLQHLQLQRLQLE